MKEKFIPGKEETLGAKAFWYESLCKTADIFADTIRTELSEEIYRQVNYVNDIMRADYGDDPWNEKN